MTRFNRILSLVTSSLLLNCCVGSNSLKTSGDPDFSVKVNPMYARPLLGWMPPSDKNHEKPRQILIRFLENVRTSKYDDAASLCYFGWRLGDGVSDPKDWETIKGSEFRMICETLRNQIKEVVISGSTIRQKGDYYSIQCKFIDSQGNHSEIIVYFLQINDVWKLRETSVSDIYRRIQSASNIEICITGWPQDRMHKAKKIALAHPQVLGVDQKNEVGGCLHLSIDFVGGTSSKIKNDLRDELNSTQ